MKSPVNLCPENKRVREGEGRGEDRRGEVRWEPGSMCPGKRRGAEKGRRRDEACGCPASGRTKQKKNHAYQWLLAAGRPKPGISQAALDCQSWPNLKRDNSFSIIRAQGVSVWVLS